MRYRDRVLVCVCVAGILAVTWLVAQEATPAVAGGVPSAALAEVDAFALETEGAAGPPTILELLQKGGTLMYPLYLCSFLMVAFCIERVLGLRTERIIPRDVAHRIRTFSTEKHGPSDAGKLLAEIEGWDSPMTRVVKAGLRKAGRSIPEIEKAIEDAGAREAAGMRRNCRVFSIVASISPLLGLLGTVLGMIQAFMTVAAREEALGRTELLAAGIYQALVTTAAGLAVAIPALVLYYFFVDKVDRLVNELDDISIDLVESMSTED